VLIALVIKTIHEMHKAVFILFLCLVAVKPNARIIYVNANATGLNDGSSWANARRNLPVISAPVGSPNTFYITGVSDTFWVANGVYKPGDSADACFWLGDSTKIFGGFTGSETSLSQRNWSTFQTILDGNAGLANVKTDNNKWIIVIKNRSVFRPSDFRLDGFKIINEYDTTGLGSAVLSDLAYTNDRAVIANCSFSNNKSVLGSAMLLGSTGDIVIQNCSFTQNTSVNGGAIARYTGVVAGAFLKGSLEVTDCTFSDNNAQRGGAVFIPDSMRTVFNRCLFTGNNAKSFGGALYGAYRSQIKLFNCAILGNAADTAGAFYIEPAAPGERSGGRTIVHCTVAANKTRNTVLGDYAIPLYGYDTIINNIIWDNITGTGKQMRMPLANSLVSTNLVTGGAIPGTLNTYGFTPQFVAPIAATMAPFAPGSSYNYRLASRSGAIDKALAGVIPISYRNQDLDRQARIYSIAPDLGAYENVYCNALDVSIKASAPTSFCKPDSIKLSASGGTSGVYYWNGDTMSISNIWAKDSGIYQVITVTPSGCRAAAYLLVNAYAKPNPIITRTNNTLGVSATFASYQWYNGNTPIAGATSAAYSPSSNGLYKIVVISSPGGCKDSTTYNLTNLLVAGTSSSTGLRIYPNPVKNGKCNISIDDNRPIRLLGLFDVSGREILCRQYLNSNSTELDLTTLANGLYVLKLSVGEEVIVRRLIVN
jgi:predicted outer membrane repeat protein